MIGRISVRTGLCEMVGYPELCPGSKQKGYTHSYAFPKMLGNLTVSYHENRPDMGICVNFSATALNEYCASASECFNKPVTVVTLLKKLNFFGYVTRVSRIDIAVDYIDFQSPFSGSKGNYFSVDEIYKKFEDGKIRVCNQSGVSRLSAPKAIETDYSCETIYLGSKQSESFLRIYDKKAEQLDKQAKGKSDPTHYDTARACKAWVRIEAVYRGSYAKQIGDYLMQLSEDSSLSSVLAGFFTDKYQFYNGDTPLNITKSLLKLRGDKTPHLESIKVKDTGLEKKITNLLEGSSLKGIMLYMYVIYGADGLSDLSTFFTRYLYEYILPLYKQAQETQITQSWALRSRLEWLHKHMGSTLKAFPTSSDLLNHLWDKGLNTMP